VRMVGSIVGPRAAPVHSAEPLCPKVHSRYLPDRG
jgi:hypothetical protein